MNERIFELADQASHQSPDGYPVTIPYSKDFAQKFAELIVRECASIVNSLEQYEGQGDCSTAEYIKEHFGVEE